MTTPPYRGLLRDWMLGRCRSSTSSSSSSSSSSHVQQQHHPTDPSPLPRILVLDGGVSTHLQDKLAATTTTTTTSHEFPYRELWSSSLLVPSDDNDNNNEKDDDSSPHYGLVRQGHLDWLQAGANVISTVTYQCHYEAYYWPQQQRTETKQRAVVTEEIMNDMWTTGLRLARQAIQEHEATSTTTKQQPVVEQRDHPSDAFSSSVETANTSSTMQSTTTTTHHHHFVLASSGCYGAILANGAEYTGDYGEHVTIQDLEQFHQRKLLAILSSQPQLLPDGIAVETVPSLAECRALRNLFLADGMTDQNGTSSSPSSSSPSCLADTNIAVMVSLACCDESHLNDKTPLEQALQVLWEIPTSRLQAVGLNCCNVAHVPALLDILVTSLAKQYNNNSNNNNHDDDDDPPNEMRGIVLYPNSGEVYEASTDSWHDGTSGCCSTNMTADWSQQVVAAIRQVETRWRQLQPIAPFPSILVGGCCRTRPTSIASLRQAVDEHLLRGNQKNGE